MGYLVHCKGVNIHEMGVTRKVIDFRYWLFPHT